MKATDFRLGNLYQYFIRDKMDPRVAWWEACEMDIDSLTWLFSNPRDNDYQPIPLTEGWLLRLNFKQILSSRLIFRVDLEGYEFEIDESGGKFYYEGREVKAVHQLQNLVYALTGEELTIKGDAPNSL